MQTNMRAIVIMGVAGSGKSTVAQAVCERLGAHFIEGDDFHGPANIRKMHAGIALTDQDRQGWLERLAQEITHQLTVHARVVLSCSALKRRYRDTLRSAAPHLGFVVLELTPQQATARVSHRTGHFMPSSLIDSQYRDLELPHGEPCVLTASATLPVRLTVDTVANWWAAMDDRTP